MCGCRGHGHEGILLTTEGRGASGGKGMNVAEVPTPEALLVGMDREDQCMDVALLLVVLEGFFMFV